MAQGEKKKLSECDLKKCTNRGVFNPVINVRGIDAPIGSPYAKCVLSLKICKTHMDELKVEDLLTDEGWEQIRNGFAFRNRAFPDRQSAILSRKRIHSS